MTALATLASVVARATPESVEEQALLDEASAVLAGEETLTVSEVAERLGVSSPTTIHNWLEKGYFPGVIRTPGGHRRFHLADVIEVERVMAIVRASNDSGTLEFPDTGDEDPYGR